MEFCILLLLLLLLVKAFACNTWCWLAITALLENPPCIIPKYASAAQAPAAMHS
jgi:hypothetical protein